MRQGDVLNGRYEILGKLDKGGEAEILIAWDLISQVKVAVKCQFPQRFDSSATFEYRSRGIRREYRRLQALADIPGITKVLDQGHVGGGNGGQFLVMEYVEGPTVKSWIKDHQPVPSVAAASVLAQLCETLSHVHAKGYIHRDLTPGNVMVQPDGRVRLLDVGIAVRSGKLNCFPGGSPGYASPEQYDRESKLTPQVDVFALGAMWFEMTICELPYGGREGPPVPAEHPFPAGFPGGFGEGMRALGLAMVSHDPRDRPEGVGEVLRRLQPMLPVSGAPASPKATKPDPTSYYRAGESAK
ncbi:serine/threonine-protein kinase [Streptosporangium oxazolinicum]|uniref:serine/threonine protein kinase n=1 Tax=Streptosporangium oxazolinicum TaxID=909287 RepID=UPI0031EDF97D